MYALTVRQPWASLIAAGLKTRELRVWSTSYRGPLWIHAGAHRSPGVDELPISALVARVSLAAIVAEDPLWVWLLRNAEPLPRPIECRGAQGLWRVPSRVQRLAERQLRFR